jgi:hypothetical protein
MRKKLLNLAAILASLMGYLEWGKDQSVFLYEAEVQLVAKALVDPAAAVHPFTILPLLGQTALVLTLFQKNASKALSLVGITGIGLLLGLMFAIGLLTLNVRILASTIPFLVVAGLTVREHLRRPQASALNKPVEA